MVLAEAEVKLKDKAGVVVGVVTLVVNKGAALPDENEVTVPVPAAC